MHRLEKIIRAYINEMIFELDRGRIDLNEIHRLVYEQAKLIGLKISDLIICEYNQDKITLQPSCVKHIDPKLNKGWYWQFQYIELPK